MFDKKLLDTLLSVGFTQNGAKAYMALLEESPLSGYAVALKSGVTRARTYDALNRLEELGYVRAKPGRPITYTPVSIEEIVSAQRELERRRLKEAEQALSQVKQKKASLDSMMCVTGYNTIMQTIRSNIELAREKILLYIRKEEFEILTDSLQAAAERGVRIFVVFAVDSETDVSCNFVEDCTYVQRFHSEQARQGNRWTIITLDDRAGFVGITSWGERSMAVSTFNAAYVTFMSTNIATYFVERDYIAAEKGPHFTSMEHSAYAAFRRDLASQ